MVYQTLGDANVTTLSGLFVYISSQIPLFIPLLLTALFVIVALSSYYAQQRTRGTANFWGCIAVAGYLTAVTSIMMSFIPNLINAYVVVVCIVIAIIGTAFLLTRSNEQ